MGILGAMAKAAVKEVKKSVNRKKRALLKKASGKPVKVNRSSTRATTTKRRTKKRLPANKRGA